MLPSHCCSRAGKPLPFRSSLFTCGLSNASCSLTGHRHPWILVSIPADQNIALQGNIPPPFFLFNKFKRSTSRVSTGIWWFDNIMIKSSSPFLFPVRSNNLSRYFVDRSSFYFSAWMIPPVNSSGSFAISFAWSAPFVCFYLSITNVLIA